MRFDREIEPSTLNTNNFQLWANGERLAGRIEVSSTRRFATLFPANPFPPSTEVRIVVDGTNIRSREGWSFSAAPDVTLQPFNDVTFSADFRTLPLFRIPGTHVWGYVYDSYNCRPDGSNIPVIGATIRVDAFPEANAVTDTNGYFILRDMPAPEFFVYGRKA